MQNNINNSTLDTEQEVNNPATDQEQKKKERNKKKRRIIETIVLIIIIILLLLRGCGSFGTVPPEPTQTASGNVTVGDKQEMQPEDYVENADAVDTITFAGYGKYTISENYPNIELYNPEQNKVSFFFTLSDKETGDVIATTGVVNPSEYAYVNAYDYYQTAGTYKVIVQIDTISADGERMNGMTEYMDLYVIDEN